MYDTYVIMQDDTIDSIATRFNISPEIIYQLNGKNLSIIPGNTLVVPKNNNSLFDYYMVNKGDTLYKIASENNIDPELLAELNGINKTDYIYPNQTLLVPKPGTILYITAVGDTLSGIVKGLNVDVNKLLSQNNNIYLQPEQLIVYKYK